MIKNIKIKDIGELKNGLNFNKDQFGKGIPVVNVKNLFNGRFVDLKNLEEIKTDGISNLKSYLINEGDILFSRSSVVRSGAGKSALVPNLKKNFTFSGFIIRLRIKDKKKFDPSFLNYVLSTNKYRKLFQQYSTGTSISNVSQDLINSVEIDFPDILTQRRLSKAISFFDDKIETNIRLNSSLKMISDKIFKSWFINFDPVKAKINGHTTDLSEEINNLFPNSMQDSQLGKIPKGWKVSKLSNFDFEIESGRRPQGGIDKSLKEGTPSVGAESITSIGNFDYSKVKYVHDEFSRIQKKGKVQNFDVALYKDGGRPGEFLPRVSLYGDGFPFKNFLVNEHVFLLRSKFLGQPFLYFLVSNQNFLEQLMALGSSKAAQPGLNQEEVKNILFVLPDKMLIDHFNTLIKPILKKQLLIGLQNKNLIKIRDIVLPKILSGEIDLQDFDKKIQSKIL